MPSTDPYYLIRDRFAGVEGRSLRAGKRGQGKVIARQGGVSIRFAFLALSPADSRIVVRIGGRVNAGGLS